MRGCNSTGRAVRIKISLLIFFWNQEVQESHKSTTENYSYAWSKEGYSEEDWDPSLAGFIYSCLSPHAGCCWHRVMSSISPDCHGDTYYWWHLTLNLWSETPKDAEKGEMVQFCQQIENHWFGIGEPPKNSELKGTRACQ